MLLVSSFAWRDKVEGKKSEGEVHEVIPPMFTVKGETCYAALKENGNEEGREGSISLLSLEQASSFFCWSVVS